MSNDQRTMNKIYFWNWYKPDLNIIYAIADVIVNSLTAADTIAVPGRNTQATLCAFLWWLVGEMDVSLVRYAGVIITSQWAHDVITSLSRQNDVATLFWRNNDVIIAPCARWDGFMQKRRDSGTGVTSSIYFTLGHPHSAQRT